MTNRISSEPAPGAPRHDTPQNYPFPGADEKNGYRVFPVALENDPDVFFHGTAAANLPGILELGFLIRGNLPSVSFAHDSTVPLKYACDARSKASPEGCIIAVRFADIKEPHIIRDTSGLLVYDMAVPHEIVGYCIIPAAYRFV